MYFFLCFDEIQACYVIPEPRNENKEEVEAAAKILREILVLGKDTSNVATILTGSSKRAVRYAHHLDLAELGMEKIAEKYPNLNHSVFEKSLLKPLRSAAEMEAAFPHKQPAERAAMFYASGGVGRRLMSQFQGPRLPQSFGLLEIVTALLLKGGFVTHDNTTSTVNEEPSALEALVNNPWEMPSLSWKEMEQILAGKSEASTPERRQQDANRKLLLAQDDGMLYEQDGRVTLLVPQHFAAYAKLLANYGSDKSSRLGYLFQMVLAGIKGSPGSELEAPILQTAVENHVLSEEDLVFEFRRLSFAGGKITVQTLDGKDVETWGASDLLPEMTVFQLTKDMGADGVWFKCKEGEMVTERKGKETVPQCRWVYRDIVKQMSSQSLSSHLQGEPKAYEVHLVQIKTGDVKKKITLGGVGSVPVKLRTKAEQCKKKKTSFNKESVQNAMASISLSLTHTHTHSLSLFLSPPPAPHPTPFYTWPATSTQTFLLLQRRDAAGDFQPSRPCGVSSAGRGVSWQEARPLLDQAAVDKEGGAG